MSTELLHIEIDSKRVEDKLALLKSATEDLTPVMTDIAATLWEKIGERFETHKDPVGRQWAEKKDGEPSVLYDSGSMLNSLTRSSGPTHAMVGFGQPYAAYHEFGTKYMPRRGLLFADPETGTLSAEDEQYILELVNRHLRAALDD
jgi:phage virion morphogenesis protein